MWLLMTVLSAWAAPDRIAYRDTVASGLYDLAVTTDGRWVATLSSGDAELHVIDTKSWDEDNLYASVCSSPVGIAAVDNGDGTARFYVGCSGGQVSWADVSEGTITVNTSGAVTVASGSIDGLVAGDGYIYVADDPGSSGALTIHSMATDTYAVDDATGFPVDLTYSGYEDMVYTGTYIIVVHGTDNVSQIAALTGSLTGPTEIWPSAACSDEEVTPDGDTVLIACGDEGVMRYIPNDETLLEDLTSSDGLTSPTAVAIDAPSDEDASLLVVDGSSLLEYPFDAGTALTTGDPSTLDISGATVGPLQSVNGYTYAVTDGGEIWVLSDRPWVAISSVSPTSSAIDGDTVTVSFTSDLSGTYTLYLGDSSGTELDSGSVTADTSTDASFTINSAFAEGDNALYLVVTADGLDGHDATSVTVDNPPSQVVLNDTSLGFGNEQLTLAFDGITDADLDHYVVYVTTTPFVADDYPTDGPDYEGPDTVDYPETLSNYGPGDAVSVTLSPLTNGETYYVAVRAWDLGGQESPMSTVVSGSPEETYSVSEITGEKGGFCGLVSPVSAGLALLAAGLVALRRRSVPALAAVLAVGALGSSTARADDDTGFRADAPRGSVSLRYGPLWFADDNPILDQFTSGQQVLWLEGGPSLWGLLNMNLGIGWYQEMGDLIGASGALSDEHDMLTALPFTLGLTARLDVLKEQPIVPYVSIGGDYWLWKENWYVSSSVGGTDHVGGGKSGWHYSVGGQLLLDSFEPARASLIQARKGIRDTYFTADYRVQNIGTSGIDFSARSLTLGLMINY